MNKKYQCRAVACFDVMGFKDSLYRNGINGVANIINELSEIVDGVRTAETNLIYKNGNVFDDQTIMPVLFSDTILFISHGESIGAVLKIIIASAYLLDRAFKTEIPLKGALAFGEFIGDFNDNLQPGKFYGMPLVDADNLSKEIHFYGAVLHHTLESYIKNKTEADDYQKFNRVFSGVLKEGKVPIKNGGCATHVFIDWTDISDGNKKELISNFYKTSSGSIRKYVDNTSKVYNEHHSSIVMPRKY